MDLSCAYLLKLKKTSKFLDVAAHYSETQKKCKLYRFFGKAPIVKRV